MKIMSQKKFLARQWFYFLAGIILLGWALALYLPSFKVPFHFDDMESIINNHYIRITDLSLNSLVRSAFQDRLHNRPLSNLSLALNYYFNQLNPFGYHLVNFLGLIFTALGIWLLLEKFLTRIGFEQTRARFISWLTALVWVSHPLNIQAITYIVQRHASLAGAFSIWSLLLFHLGMEKKSAKILKAVLFLGSGIFCLLAILSKETAFTLPLIIFIYKLFFFDQLKPSWLKRNWMTILGLGVFYLVSLLLIFRTEMIEKLFSDFQKMPFSPYERFLTEPRVLLWYLWLIIFPLPQFLNIEHYFSISGSFFEPITTLLSMIFILGLFFLAIFNARKWKIISFTIFWYLSQVLIEALPLPIDLVSEHRLYLANLAVIVPVISGLSLKIKNQKYFFGWLFLLVAFLGFFTWTRNQIWLSRETLWKDAVKKAPVLFRPWNNYCSALVESNKCQIAFRVCEKGVELDAYKPEPHNNLAICYFKTDQIELAEKEFLSAVELSPEKKGIAYFNLGMLYARKKDYQTAVKWFRLAIEKEPFNAKNRYNLAITYLYLGQTEKAISELEKAVELGPEFKEARFQLAEIFANQGNCPEALKLIKSAPQSDPIFEPIIKSCPE